MIWSLVKIMGLLHDIPCGKTQTKNLQKIKNHIFLLFNRFDSPRRGKVMLIRISTLLYIFLMEDR